MSEAIAHQLSRLADYWQGALDQTDRNLLKAAADALRGPAMAEQQTFKLLSDLVALMADPAAVKQRIDALSVAKTEARAAEAASVRRQVTHQRRA
jgi:hypothetical protein